MYKLVIVEDEEIIREGITDNINWNSIGFKVVGKLDNGRSAIELVRHEAPDVILADIKMPEMDGITLMSELRQTHPEIKVVILSGYNDFEYARKSIEYDAYSYLLKPVRESEINDVFGKLKKELDYINESKKALESLDKKARIGISAYKEKFLTELIEGKYTEKDRSFVLDNFINIYDGMFSNGAFFFVILFQPAGTNPDNTAIINTANIFLSDILYDRIRFILDGLLEKNNLHNLGILKLFSSNICAVIIASEIFLTSDETDRIMSLVCDYITGTPDGNNSGNLDFYCGVGRFYEDILKIGLSYKEAFIALERKFYCNKKILHFDKIEDDKELIKKKVIYSDISTHTLSDHIINAVMSADEAEAFNLFTKYLSLLLASGSNNLEEIYVKIIEMIVILSSRLYEKEIMLQEMVSENIHSRIRYIVQSETMNELKEYIRQLFHSIANQIQSTDSFKTTREKDSINRVKEYIDENYHKKISLEELAGIVFISPKYFSTFFKQNTGYTVTDYITMKRMEKAKEFMKNVNLKVYEIALMVGYDDFRYFSKVFRKYFGIKPVQYKKYKA